MRTLLLSGLLLSPLLAACGDPPRRGPDAGTSCDFACSQSLYGLTAKRCFEYSKTSTAAALADLGVWVDSPVQLEGGLEVVPVEYRISNQRYMTDYFALTGGDLLLARREFGPGTSITYRSGDTSITGVAWLRANTVVGEAISSQVNADTISGGTRSSDPITLKGSPIAASTTDLKVPLKAYEEGLRMSYVETPDHAADQLRVFVRDVGFVRFSTFLAYPRPTGVNQTIYSLQKVREVGTNDPECSLGVP